MNRSRYLLPLGVALAVSGAITHAGEACQARIEIRVDAEVADARDPSFLSGLLANPQYRLTWMSGDADSDIYVLSGPAEDAGCANMVEQVRKAAAVLDVKVLEPEAPPDA